ncbi:hypothetical protein [Novosphingobium clariflavum]|uniref:Secreted protein n=1 Tax=Novosphingobium clariflavum TaxID=2029884 RepID=A0ABV6S8J2_9SPHN|nr:hypothetical protein [Novosphingobium clariflavum]
MSRIWRALFAIATLSPAAAMAQENPAGTAAAKASSGTAATTGNTISDADKAIAEKMMAGGGRITPDRSHRACVRNTRAGEIVVCAPDEDQFRVESTADSDPTGKAGTNDGRLRAPDFEKHMPGVTVAKGCFIPPCPPAQPLIIDLSQIPEAPAGSDADLVAKGELRAH